MKICKMCGTKFDNSKTLCPMCGAKYHNFEQINQDKTKDNFEKTSKEELIEKKVPKEEQKIDSIEKETKVKDEKSVSNNQNKKSKISTIITILIFLIISPFVLEFLKFPESITLVLLIFTPLELFALLVTLVYLIFYKKPKENAKSSNVFLFTIGKILLILFLVDVIGILIFVISAYIYCTSVVTFCY